MPTSTTSLSSKPNSKGANSTQSHARQLRVLLESLDDIRRERAQNVMRAKRLADSEDITPRILRAAAAVERWVEVQPSMFEDVLDEALTKYEKFREEIEAGEQKQEVVLESITVSVNRLQHGMRAHQNTLLRNVIDCSYSLVKKIYRSRSVNMPSNPWILRIINTRR